jgi:hypothetical protein
MPNSLDTNGLIITTLSEVLANLTADYQNIYGADINLDSNSPDGQMMNIFAQAIQDLTSFLASIYTSFDPQQAIGVNLDSRVALNNLTRKAGVYSTVYVDIVTDRALNLIGLDGVDSSLAPTGTFAISDSAGTQWYLSTSQTITAAGTHSCLFTAKTMGVNIAAINTLTTIITITLGVKSVNNSATTLIVGQDEESDVQLRLRQQRSTAILSTGFKESMIGSLLALAGVEDCSVLENNTAITDTNGITAHSYWIIVKASTATSAEIGNVIYESRSGGSGMRGSIAVNITEIDGGLFIVKYDNAVAEPLYVKFGVRVLTGDGSVDKDYIKQQMVLNSSFNIGQEANKSYFEAMVYDLYTNIYLQDMQVSGNGMSYVDLLDPKTLVNYFTLDATNISISDV